MTFLLIVCVSLLAAFWGSLSGTENAKKFWRRLVVPGLSTVFALFKFHNLGMIWLFTRCAAMSMGYGIPDPKTGDKGSKIGAFWYDQLGNAREAGVYTRATIGLIEGLSLVFVPVLVGGFFAWLLWLVAVAAVMCNHVYWGAINEKTGMVNIIGREFNVEEALIHGINTLIELVFFVVVHVLCK